jgi:hypothetical protein
MNWVRYHQNRILTNFDKVLIVTTHISPISWSIDLIYFAWLLNYPTPCLQFALNIKQIDQEVSEISSKASFDRISTVVSVLLYFNNIFPISWSICFIFFGNWRQKVGQNIGYFYLFKNLSWTGFLRFFAVLVRFFEYFLFWKTGPVPVLWPKNRNGPDLKALATTTNCATRMSDNSRGPGLRIEMAKVCSFFKFYLWLFMSRLWPIVLEGLVHRTG